MFDLRLKKGLKELSNDVVVFVGILLYDETTQQDGDEEVFKNQDRSMHEYLIIFFDLDGDVIIETDTRSRSFEWLINFFSRDYFNIKWDTLIFWEIFIPRY